MGALWEDLAVALANHAMSGSSVGPALAESIQACSDFSNPSYLSVSILLDNKTLAAVHNLASAPGTDSSIVLYTSRKSLGHKALQSGSGKLVVKRRDDVVPGSVRWTTRVDGRLYSQTTAMNLVSMAIPAAPHATASGNTDVHQPYLGAIIAGWAGELPPLDRLEEGMRELTRHLSHHLPVHMPAFFDDLASFAPLLLPQRPRELHSEGHPAVPSPTEAGLDGCTPPDGDRDPDLDPSGTSSRLSAAETPSIGPDPVPAEPSRPDMSHGAGSSGDLTLESGGTSGRTFRFGEGSKASMSSGGMMPPPSRGGESGGDDGVNDAGPNTGCEGEVAAEDSQQEGKRAAAPAAAVRNFGLTASWLFKRFVDPEVEREFCLESAITNQMVDGALLLLAACAVCIVHFAPPFYLIRFSLSFVWPLGFCTGFLWFLMYNNWYLQHRDVVAAAFCAATRLQALRATYICFMHIPEAHAMAGQRWMWAIPIHFALESFFLVRDSWVRVILFTLAVAGCINGFPVGYGSLSPHWAALRGVAHLTVAELISIGIRRWMDSLARASFVERRSAIST